MTKSILLGLALVLIGCGSADDAGADANAVCRPPQGCEARVVSDGSCRYLCGVGDSGLSLYACVPLADGGAVGQGDFGGGVPPEIAAEGRVYAADPGADPNNCRRCGARCAVGEVCSAARGCYMPRP